MLDPETTKAKALVALGADVVAGNLDDHERLHAAMGGIHGVFCVVPLVTSFMPGGSFEYQLACSKNLIAAAATAKLDDVVPSSDNSADKPVTPCITGNQRRPSAVRCYS